VRKAAAKNATKNGHQAQATVVRLPTRSPRGRSDVAPRQGCAKCGSSFVVLEPAFVHCRFCGSLSRRVGGSMLEQELFELRSGLRLAS